MAFAFACQHLERNNPRQDVVAGVLYAFGRWYARHRHRLQVFGTQHLPGNNLGPLIVVANHTAGIDPLLVQTACPFEIRWMMAADMRHPRGEPFWQWMKIIFVDRTRPDTTALRLAIRHVKAGGVLGIFPEGKIERPKGQLLPFQRGVGTLVKQTGAAVLPVLIEGTPDAETAWGSILKRSQSRVTFLEPVCYGKSDPSAQEIAADLRSRIDSAKVAGPSAQPTSRESSSRLDAAQPQTNHAPAAQTDALAIQTSRARITPRHTEGGQIAAGM